MASQRLAPRVTSARRASILDMRFLSSSLDAVSQDLRYTFRQLAKNPGFTATAILMLALGLCASVSIFAFVDAALLQPLPYSDPARLVGVYEHITQCPLCNLSYFDYLDWKKLNKVFTSLEAYHGTGYILTTPSGVEPARAAQVSAGFFHVLGVAPALGRDFHAGEDSGWSSPNGAIKQCHMAEEIRRQSPRSWDRPWCWMARLT